MQKAATRKKRPYMASQDRRRAHLDAAAEMVGRFGRPTRPFETRLEFGMTVAKDNDRL